MALSSCEILRQEWLAHAWFIRSTNAPVMSGGYRWERSIRTAHAEM